MVALYRRAGGDGQLGAAQLLERRPRLVMDRCCRHRVVELRKSIWASRTVTLGFSPLGALQSYGTGGTSSAAAAVESVEQAPTAISGALEQSARLRGDLASLEHAPRPG